MTGVYWPLDEFRCQPELSDPRTIHMHHTMDLAACLSFRLMGRAIVMRTKEWPGGTLIGAPANIRTMCITGPGGRLLRDVLYSPDEIAAVIRRRLAGPPRDHTIGHGATKANQTNVLE